MASRDPAADQLREYKEKVKSTQPHFATTAGGAILVNKDRSLTVGARGPIPISDVQFVEEIAHFVRERIPERVLHAKGAGAFGNFISTGNITHLTKAKVFIPSKRTQVAVRFSTTVGESGAAESVRDPKGMSVKFYTDDGIFDLSGNHTPTFFLRDPILFPSLVHANKRNPKTHLHDMNMFWDFMSQVPETMSTLLHLFSRTGIPDGWRKMNAYPTNVYKLVNDQGIGHYCKFIFYCHQTKEYLSTKEAGQKHPDYYSKDLYNAIAKGDYPVWTLKIQVMTEAQARHLLYRPVNPFDPFDNTKDWSTVEFPPIDVGVLTLTSNPSNYFAEIEQLAFAPANMVPGIQPSSHDKVLQGRIFAYPDAQRYRLGPNYQQLAVNIPLNVRTYQKDGASTAHHEGEKPNYHPNSFLGSRDVQIRPQRIEIMDDIFQSFVPPPDDDIWQNQMYYQGLDNSEKRTLASNIAESLKMVTDMVVRNNMLGRFKNVDDGLFNSIMSYL